jgi:FSR family fosmidomycin resistance protein-like MFS transporter
VPVDPLVEVGAETVSAGRPAAGGAALARPNLKLLSALSFGHMVVDVNQGALLALLPFLKTALGLSYAGSGAIILVSNLTSSVIQPLFGYLSDRSSRRWLLPLSVVAAGAGAALVGVATTYAVILVLVVLSGLGVAAYHPEGFRAASEVAGDRKATGLSFFSIGGNAGFALGPPVTTALIAWFGLPGSLGLLVLSLIASALLLAVLPWLAPAAEAHPAAPTTGDRRETRAGAMGVLIVVILLRSWTQLGFTTFIPFFYVDDLGADPQLVGPLLFVFLGAGALGTLAGGPIADRWGPRRFLVAVFFLATPLAAGFLVSRGLWAFLLLGALGFVLVSSFSVSVVLAQAYLPRHLAMAAGLSVGFAIGAGGLGVALLGWVADHWGVLATLRVTAALPLLSFVAALFLPEPARS